MSKVLVKANEDGSIVCISQNNENYGHIRVEQTVAIFEKTGWLKNTKLIAFIPGKIEDLESLGYVDNQELTGKLVIKESLKPFNTKNPEKDYKKAGTTNVVCKINNQPIYRKCIYTEDLTDNHVFLEHDNGFEIKKAYEFEKSPKSALQPNLDA